MVPAISGHMPYLIIFLTTVLCLAGCGKQKEEAHHLSDLREVSAEDKTFLSDDYKRGSGPTWYRGMNYGDLAAGKKRHLDTGRLDWAIKYTERMIKLSRNGDEIERMRLELANLLFENKEYDRAGNSYTFYAESYPGSPDAIIALYKTILCRRKMILSADRDTTAAEEVVRCGGEFLAEPDNKSYRKEVEQLVADAIAILYKSDLLTFYFYLNRDQFNAAATRIGLIRDRYLDKNKPDWYTADLEPEILILEYELESGRNHQELAQAKRDDLYKRFPQYSTVHDKGSAGGVSDPTLVKKFGEKTVVEPELPMGTKLPKSPPKKPKPDYTVKF